MKQESPARRTRRSFLVGGLGFLVGYLGFRWIGSRSEEGGIPWPLRKTLQANEGIFREFFRRKRLAPGKAPVIGREPRLNGDLGIDDEEDFGGAPHYERWRLTIQTPDERGPDHQLVLSMRDIHRLPRAETSFSFKCIEGWKEDMTVGGARFSDFLARYGVGRRDRGRDAGALYRYVGLETPDGGYYVSVDMESMLHPQTLLCYEMNRMPISLDHGAPVRLIIPVKYGIKSLKRIGRIRFSDTRPPDYWAERGYDWYAGL